MSNKKKGFIHSLWIMVFISYLVVLVYFLFFSERYGRTIGSGEYHYNLQLFKEIKRFYKYRQALGVESVVVNLFGNIFAFSPLGFFLPCINKKYKSLLSVILLGFGFSLTIELLQLITRAGIFDIDDLFMNTLGAAIGYIIYLIIFGKGKKKQSVTKKT